MAKPQTATRQRHHRRRPIDAGGPPSRHLGHLQLEECSSANIVVLHCGADCGDVVVRVDDLVRLDALALSQKEAA